MTSTTPASKTLSAHCYCKAVNFTLSLPTSNLPLDAYMCHCSICRYILGALCCFHSPLPRGILPSFIGQSSAELNLTRYTWPGGKDDWVFCSTCGCHIGTVSPRRDETNSKEEDCWTISTSVFAKDESVFKLVANCFTHSAPGGLHEWVTAVGDRPLSTWNPPGSTPDAVSHQAMLNLEGEQLLLAQCHCKGVTIRLPRPPQGSTKFLSPVDSKKWIAMLCVCDSCRLTTSAHVTAWTYIPLGLVEVGGIDKGSCEWYWSAVSTDESTGHDDDMGLGLGGRSTVKVFESSPGVRRSFCGTCGATVMYGHVSRGDVVAVSMGIVRAPEGVRAEDWVTWKGGDVRAFEDGLKYDREFAEALAGGLKTWSVEKYGEAHESSSG